jgi:hypothetical protein
VRFLRSAQLPIVHGQVNRRWSSGSRHNRNSGPQRLSVRNPLETDLKSVSAHASGRPRAPSLGNVGGFFGGRHLHGSTLVDWLCGQSLVSTSPKSGKQQGIASECGGSCSDSCSEGSGFTGYFLEFPVSWKQGTGLAKQGITAVRANCVQSKSRPKVIINRQRDDSSHLRTSLAVLTKTANHN